MIHTRDLQDEPDMNGQFVIACIDDDTKSDMVNLGSIGSKECTQARIPNLLMTDDIIPNPPSYLLQQQSP